MFGNFLNASTQRPAIARAGSVWLCTIYMFSMLFATEATAAQISLAWSASPSTSVKGYTLHYGQASGSYDTSTDVGNQLSYSVGNLTSGQMYCFAVKAYDAAGAQSVYSNEACGTAPAATATADFTYTPSSLSGTAPFTVLFTNASTGATSYSWKFCNSATNACDTSTATNPTYTFNSAGSYVVTLTIQSATGTKSKVVTFTISSPPTGGTAGTPSATSPVAHDDSYSVVAGKTLRVSSPGVLSNDTSPSGKPLSASLVSSVASGSLRLGSNGSFRFTPASGFTGTRTFTYKATDGTSSSAVATVTISVTTTTGSSNTGSSNTGSSNTGSSNTGSSSTAAGLVAAYGFNEGAGYIANDLSGNGNNGTISNATWTTQGRFGKALSFNGSNSWVTVNDSTSLDLATGMTIEVWVYPKTLTGWRNVLMKEQPKPAGSAYYLELNSGKLVSGLWIGQDRQLYANPLPQNAWTHLAATYDGATRRLYINGAQVASQTQTGPIQASASPLLIGGNSVWGEYFSGLIDEIRIYNRALAINEIQGDMNRSIQ